MSIVSIEDQRNAVMDLILAECRRPGTINGVPESQWGTWCEHGHRVRVPDPKRDAAEQYPSSVIADPWPCEKCTPEELYADEMEADRLNRLAEVELERESRR